MCLRFGSDAGRDFLSASDPATVDARPSQQDKRRRKQASPADKKGGPFFWQRCLRRNP